MVIKSVLIVPPPPPPPLELELTVTVTDWVGLVPSVPTQVKVKVVVAVRAPLVAVPLVATVPDHAPVGELEAVHELVLLLDHLRLAVAPEETLVEVAWSVTVAAGGADCTTMEYVPAASVPPGCATMLRK
jgi:hypothetical protein